MKDKSKKHDHKGTKLLKLSIFFTLMLAPILAIAFKCGYVTFNKNAYVSYSETTKENVYVSNTNLPLYDVNFNFVTDDTLPTSGKDIYITNLSILDTNITQTQQDSLLQTNYLRIWYTSSLQASYITWNNLGTNLSSTNIYLILKFDVIQISNDLVNNELFYKIIDNNTLDNAFYYAINEMQESTLFNWTENTAIYTPIQAMTSGLGITTDAIAILLTYWMYLTLIYIVFDIVIELFTYLTHTLMGQPM